MTKRKTVAGKGARSWQREAEDWKFKAMSRGLTLAALAAFLSDDSAAITYQTLAQYRSAALSLIDKSE